MKSESAQRASQKLCSEARIEHGELVSAFNLNSQKLFREQSAVLGLNAEVQELKWEMEQYGFVDEVSGGYIPSDREECAATLAKREITLHETLARVSACLKKDISLRIAVDSARNHKERTEFQEEGRPFPPQPRNPEARRRHASANQQAADRARVEKDRAEAKGEAKA